MILVIDGHNDISPKIMSVELQPITHMILDIEKYLVAEFPKSKTRSLNMHYFNNIVQSTSNAKKALNTNNISPSSYHPILLFASSISQTRRPQRIPRPDERAC
jgi:hypothetical protein